MPHEASGTHPILTACIQRQAQHLLPWVRGGARAAWQEVRLDPPGLFSDTRVIGIKQWHWQYLCLGVIVFAHAGSSYVYLTPPRPHPEPLRSRLDALPCALWRQNDGELSDFDYDMGPLLLDDLRLVARVASRFQFGELSYVIALLETLSTYTGGGSEAFLPGVVTFGPQAVERLQRRLGHPITEPTRSALLAPPGDDPHSGGWHVSALVEKKERRDSTSGGYDAWAVVARLTVTQDRWSYDREVMWIEAEEGIELS